MRYMRINCEDEPECSFRPQTGRAREHITGVRYSGELGHPFHVVDDDLVILSLDHPFIPEDVLRRSWSETMNLLKNWRKASRSCGLKPCGTFLRLISILEFQPSKRRFDLDWARPKSIVWRSSKAFQFQQGGSSIGDCLRLAHNDISAALVNGWGIQK
jgi:hypothetical protein